MPRTEYTVTFPAAHAGAEVLASERIYLDEDASVPAQSVYLDPSKTVRVWSSAASVTFTCEGEDVSLTSGAATGSGADPAPSGGSNTVGLAPNLPVTSVAAVALATVAALPANTYSNGTAGVGATLTATANGALEVDGTAVQVGDRLVIAHEGGGATPTLNSKNGIYTVTATGDAGSPFRLTRATDADTPAAFADTFACPINGGTYSGGVATCFPFDSSGGPGLGDFAVGSDDLSFSLASGYGSNASDGLQNVATGFPSHAEGVQTASSGYGDHSEGRLTVASGGSSHAEGDHTTASGTGSHAEGSVTAASGNSSHAEGNGTTASGDYSHAEGRNTTASYAAHAEGGGTVASNSYAHAEGNVTEASGIASHAEGSGAIASGDYSHAEGGAHAEGVWSHAEQMSRTYQDFMWATSGGDSGGKQYSFLTCTAHTTDNTPTQVSTGSAPWTFPGFTRTALFEIRVAARRTDTPGTASAWSINCLVDGNGTDAYRLVGAHAASVVAQDAAASGWTVAVTTSGAQVLLTVTGENSKTIEWVATMKAYETFG